MVRDFHLADFFTLGNGGSGTVAIFFALAHVQQQAAVKVYGAAAFAVAALFFDVMDGRVARWRHTASPMGRELDSLADVISFGVAPACIAFSVGFDGLWDQLVLVYFVCCGISRLARYNITAEAMSQETGKVTYFEGTPIPSSVLLVFLLAAQGRGLVAPARHPPVHHVEDQGQHHERPRGVGLRRRVLGDVGHGEEDGRRAAGPVAEGEEVREVEVADHREVTRHRADSPPPSTLSSLRPS